MSNPTNNTPPTYDDVYQIVPSSYDNVRSFKNTPYGVINEPRSNRVVIPNNTYANHVSAALQTDYLCDEDEDDNYGPSEYKAAVDSTVKSDKMDKLFNAKQSTRISLGGYVTEYKMSTVQQILIVKDKPNNTFDEDCLVIRPECENIINIIRSSNTFPPQKKFVLSFVSAGEHWKEYENNKTCIIITTEGSMLIYNKFGIINNEPLLADCCCKYIKGVNINQNVEIVKINVLKDKLIEIWEKKYNELRAMKPN